VLNRSLASGLDRGFTLIGLLGVNPESWRLRQLEPILSGRRIPHQAIFPWLFATEVRDGTVECSYDSLRMAGDELFYDLIYVISLGFDQLPEALYKLEFLRQLRSRGTRIVNSIETIETCRNKVSMTLRMVSRGVRMPTTLITESVHLAVDFIRSNRPCVLKPITGLQGRGIIMIPEEMREGDIVDYVSWFQAKYGKDVIYVQRFIEHPQYDIRALVIGGEVVSKMRRFNPQGWRTNISAGAQPLPSQDDVDEIALQAAEAVGGEIVGVDILPSVEGDYYVLEVNAFPGWQGLQEVTDRSIAEAAVDYLCSLL